MSSQKLVGVNENGLPVGESHWNAKLSDHEVELVLQLREDGLTLAAIAAKMDLSKSGVAHIVSGRRRSQRPVKIKIVSIMGR